jgi:hypothetical protein
MDLIKTSSTQNITGAKNVLIGHAGFSKLDDTRIIKYIENKNNNTP